MKIETTLTTLTFVVLIGLITCTNQADSVSALFCGRVTSMFTIPAARVRSSAIALPSAVGFATAPHDAGRSAISSDNRCSRAPEVICSGFASFASSRAIAR